MNRWIVSDWHLGEDRMSIMGRPFKTGEECVEDMISRHNLVVDPSDEVIVVGDVCYQKRLDMLPVVSRFNGKKTLVRGNHDRALSDSDLAPFFHTVVPDGDGLIVEACDISCFVTHYPTRGSNCLFNLVGHIHSAWKYQLNMLNVGVDVHHFCPVNLDTIRFHLDAISKYYDDDVWVAYHSSNTEWKRIRGKPGSYFTGVAGIKGES